MRLPNPRRPRARPLAELIETCLAPVAKKRGFVAADLFAAWDDIVGVPFAATTAPERLVWSRRLLDGGEEAAEPATLILRCAGPASILVQHQAPVLLERINAFFGWRAVGRLRIVQGPIEKPRAPAPKPAPDLAPEAEAALQDRLRGIDDPGLRTALARLGRAVLSGNT